MPEHESLLKQELADGNYRKRHIKHIIRFALETSLINLRHVSGTVIELGANTGSGLTAFRQYGGHLIAVESEAILLERGISVGFLKPETDELVADDMISFLRKFSTDQSKKATLISFFGLSKLYFHNPQEFTRLALNSLSPDGAIIMTGVPGESTLNLFTTFKNILGGIIFQEGQHAYDTYGYSMRKESTDSFTPFR